MRWLRVLVGLLIVVLCCGESEARWRRGSCSTCEGTLPSQSLSVDCRAGECGAEQYDVSTAQGSANLSALHNRMAHRGGNVGYEGVAFSVVSAEDAIQRCCYWGRLTPVDIGVARGANGWFACVRYK